MSNDYDARAEARGVVSDLNAGAMPRDLAERVVAEALQRAFTAGARSIPGTAAGGDGLALAVGRAAAEAMEHRAVRFTPSTLESMGNAALAIVRSWPTPATPAAVPACDALYFRRRHFGPCRAGDSCKQERCTRDTGHKGEHDRSRAAAGTAGAK